MTAVCFFFSSRRRHTRCLSDWSSDVCSSRLVTGGGADYDWVGDTLVVTQLDYVSRWRIRSDLYHWVPGGSWRRATRGGARLVAPAGGGGGGGAVAPRAGRRPAPIPLPPGPAGR